MLEEMTKDSRKIDNLNKMDSSPKPLPSRLLAINLALAMFVLLTNGAALVIGISGKAPEVLTSVPEITGVLLSAIAVAVTAGFALVNPVYRKKALTFHAVIIVAATIFNLVWGLQLATQDHSELVSSTIRTTWSVGWLTALAAYAAYLVLNTLFVNLLQTSSIARYAYLWVGVLAFVVDVSIFMRIAASIVR